MENIGCKNVILSTGTLSVTNKQNRQIVSLTKGDPLLKLSFTTHLTSILWENYIKKSTSYLLPNETWEGLKIYTEKTHHVL